MTMTLTHPDAPGHSATATEDGWQCSCGAGNRWEDGPRPRTRATGGARRHLTAAARNNPAQEAMAQARDAAEAVRAGMAERRAEAEAEPDPEPERPASLISQFRSPPRPDAE